VFGDAVDDSQDALDGNVLAQLTDLHHVSRMDARRPGAGSPKAHLVRNPARKMGQPAMRAMRRSIGMLG
jgi:hypothetical protein